MSYLLYPWLLEFGLTTSGSQLAPTCPLQKGIGLQRTGIPERISTSRSKNPAFVTVWSSVRSGSVSEGSDYAYHQNGRALLNDRYTTVSFPPYWHKVVNRVYEFEILVCSLHSRGNVIPGAPSSLPPATGMQKLGSKQPTLSKDKLAINKSTASCPTFPAETMG